MKAVQGLQKKNTWPFFLKHAKLQFDLVSQARGKGIVLLKTYILEHFYLSPVCLFADSFSNGTHSHNLMFDFTFLHLGVWFISPRRVFYVERMAWYL